MSLNRFLENMSSRGILSAKFSVILYLLISLFIFRSVLTSPGTIGRRIDWPIPSEPYELAQMFQQALYTWDPNYLGWRKILMLSAPLNMLIGFWGLLGFSGEIVSKLLVLFETTLTGSSMYVLSEELLPSDKTRKKSLVNTKWISFFSSFIAGLFYMLSPVVFNQLCDGHIYYLFAYAIAPLIFLAYMRTINWSRTNFKYLFLVSIGIVMAAAQLQFVVMLFFILTSYLIFSERRIARLKVLTGILILTAMLAAYGSITVLVDYNYSINYLLSTSSAHLRMGWFASPLDGLLLVGYFIPYYTMSIKLSMLPIWNVASVLLTVIILLVSIFMSKNPTVKFALFLLVSSLFFVGVGGGSEWGGTPIHLWLYRNFSIFQLFRSTHNLMFVPSFAYAILVVFLLSFLLSQPRQVKTKIFSIGIFFILFLLYIHPILSGNFGGQVRTFEESLCYKEIQQLLVKDKSYYRVSYVPMTVIPAYNDSPFKEYYWCSDTMIIDSAFPVVATDVGRIDPSQRISQIIEMVFYEPKKARLTSLLQLLNIRYIILRNDVKSEFGMYSYLWQNGTAYRQVFEILKAQNLTLIRDYGMVSLWKNPLYLPHIYPATRIFWINGDVESLPSLTMLPNFNASSAIFFSLSPIVPDLKFLLHQNGTMELFKLNMTDLSKYTIGQLGSILRSSPTKLDNQSDPMLDFQEINPTEYRVFVKTTKPLFLIFSESYDPLWEADVDGKKINGHFLVNGYANAWYVNKTGTYTITLEYWPQKLFYIASAISITTVTLCILYISKNNIKTIYHYLKRK